MKQHSWILSGVVVLSISLVQLVYAIAQDETNLSPTIAYDSQNIQLAGYLSWSHDSQKLIFADIVGLPTDEWYEYDVEIGNLLETNFASIQATLEAAGCPSVPLYTRLNGQEVLPFTSPHNNFLANITATDNYTVHVTVVKCEDGDQYTLPDEISRIDGILWSADSSAFVTVNQMNPPEGQGVVIGYVTGYGLNVSDAVLHDLGRWQIEDHDFIATNAYDVSEDGSQVLLRVIGNQTDEDQESNYRLYLYNASIPAASQLISSFDAGSVITASFAPNTENKIWIFNETGIVEYDLETAMLTVIDASISSVVTQGVSLSDPATFSPDGRYLAVAGHNGLYIVDLSDHVAEADGVIAQNSQPEPVIDFSQVAPGLAMWSNDSEQFLLLNIINPSNNEWYSYEVESESVEISDTWPLQPELAFDETQLHQPYVPPEGEENLVFSSPTGRYLVYATALVDPGIALVEIAIADREQEQSIEFSGDLRAITNVFWSAEENGVAISSGIFPEQKRVWYVSDYAADVSRAVIHEVRPQSDNRLDYAIRGVYDLSNDGAYVLLRVSEYNLETRVENARLYLYDAHVPTGDRILKDYDASGVVAASFAPGDESKLWIVDERGLIQYDLATDTVSILNVEFRSSTTLPPFNALFSPDGRYLAVLQESGLYILDLTVEAAQVANGHSK